MTPLDRDLLARLDELRNMLATANAAAIRTDELVAELREWKVPWAVIGEAQGLSAEHARQRGPERRRKRQDYEAFERRRKLPGGKK